MPIYEFKHNETGEIWTETMSYDDKDSYMEERNCSSYFSTFPSVISGLGDVHSKTDDNFKERMKQMKKGAGSGNTIP